MASQSVASADSFNKQRLQFYAVRLEALVKEYFTRNDDITDCESSDSNAEGFPNINVFSFIIIYS